MVERAGNLRFAPGAAVFPGGRVDPGDHAIAAAIAPALDPADGAARVAAVRETLEEAGLATSLAHPVSAQEAAVARLAVAAGEPFGDVLRRLGWQLDLAHLTPFARWRPDWAGAFDTRFYLANLGTGAVTLSADGTENTRLLWASAADALAEGDAGALHLIFPTRRNLERLAQFPDFAEAKAHAEAMPPSIITPQRIERDGEDWLTIPEKLGYPVTGEPWLTARRG